MLKGTKGRHTDVLRSACAGDVETIVYSRLKSIFSIVVRIRGDGTCDVLGGSCSRRHCSTVYHESRHADVRCFSPSTGDETGRGRLKNTDGWSGTIDNAKADGGALG